MSSQLSLFDAPVTSTDRITSMLGAETVNFVWWCRNGNQEMCAAVLVNSYGLGRDDALSLVKAA